MAGSGGRGGSTGRPDAGRAPDAGPGAGMPPGGTSPLVFGVTVDDVARVDAIVEALRSFTVRPTVRVVFDLENQPSYYARPVARISEVADVMGEILDSFEVGRISVAAYRARAEAYMDALGSSVDVWEIGNEINGEWLGRTEDVVFATLWYPGGVVPNVTASWLSPKKVREITLVGDRKMATWNDLAPGPVAIHDQGALVEPYYENFGEFFQLSVREGDVTIPRVSSAARRSVAASTGFTE